MAPPTSSPVRHCSTTTHETGHLDRAPVRSGNADPRGRMGWKEALVRYRCLDCSGPGLTGDGGVCGACQPVDARRREAAMSDVPGTRLVDGPFPVRYVVVDGAVVDRADDAVVWEDVREGERMARMVADGRNARWWPHLRGCPAYARAWY